MHTCKCPWAKTPHATFGQCMRSKNLKVAYCQSAKGLDLTAQKTWDKNLDAYAAARREGMQPDSTQPKAVMKAKEWSDREGVAYGSTGGVESLGWD